MHEFRIKTWAHVAAWAGICNSDDFVVVLARKIKNAMAIPGYWELLKMFRQTLHASHEIHSATVAS